jgi:hypothetical protein
MSEINKTYRLQNNTIATLKMKSVAQMTKETGLTPNSSLQAFHTNNVLRRIIKYWVRRTGMTIKVMVAQTDIQKPKIVLDVPYGEMLFTGENHKGTKINYTKIKHPLAGPRPDKALEAAEGDALAADLKREIQRRGIP